MFARHLRLTLLLAGIAASTAACTNPYSPGQRAAGGALIGAGGGAAIGALAGGGEGAAIGAIAGGLTGAAVGALTTPQAPRRDCWRRRYDGRVVCR
ncbi:MAG: cell envelope biogenesis protein OmpA [Roseococcus sp.]|nr:cell envelope biogenesis protein OmpA [Roseococcus sp.]